jgi:hypothetical protein
MSLDRYPSTEIKVITHSVDGILRLYRTAHAVVEEGASYPDLADQVDKQNVQTVKPLYMLCALVQYYFANKLFFVFTLVVCDKIRGSKSIKWEALWLMNKNSSPSSRRER